MNLLLFTLSKLYNDNTNYIFLSQQNKTGIIDLTSRRCYVMPLDRSHVLPPRSMHDLIKKIWLGEYVCMR